MVAKSVIRDFNYSLHYLIVNYCFIIVNVAFLGLRCPNDPNDENRLYKFEFYASPYDCQRYFVCVNGRPRLQVCEEGKAFSQLENTCLPAHNVSGW